MHDCSGEVIIDHEPRGITDRQHKCGRGIREELTNFAVYIFFFFCCLWVGFRFYRLHLVFSCISFFELWMIDVLVACLQSPTG